MSDDPEKRSGSGTQLKYEMTPKTPLWLHFYGLILLFDLVRGIFSKGVSGHMGLFKEMGKSI